MTGNFYILLFSFLLIILLSLYIQKLREFYIFDVYIIFVLFHFGFYPFVRGLYFGKGIIFDFTHADPLSIGLVFIQVLLILMIIKLLTEKLIKNKNPLKINYLVKSYSQVNNYLIYFICCVLILFPIYSYYRYGVQWVIPHSDFVKIGKSLPYWFTSVRTIYNLVSFLVCLVLISKVFHTEERKNQIFWLFLTIIFVPFTSIYGGKRYFFSIMILLLIIYFDNKHENIFQLRNLKYGLVLLMAFVLFSNLFESYRNFLINVGKITPNEIKELKNPLAAAVNFHATLSFLEKRPGTWEFSYLVLSKQIKDGIPTTKGKIYREGIKSAIPRYLWPNKKFSLIDNMLGKLYGVRPKAIDIGKNIFGVMQVEFGFLSIILVPSVIVLLFLLMKFLNQITVQYPVFLWLFSGNILYYLISIEQDGTDIFFMLRYILFISLLFVIFILGKNMYSIVRGKVNLARQI
jgi:hypothetical protein